MDALDLLKRGVVALEHIATAMSLTMGEQFIPRSEALRRIGGNQDDASALLDAAIRDGRVKSITVAGSGRVRVWGPDLGRVGEKPIRASKSRKKASRLRLGS